MKKQHKYYQTSKICNTNIAIKGGSMKKYETKDSGERKVYTSGLHRDAGEKPLYTEVYYPLVKRHAELMMRGAIKYDRGNWKKAHTAEDLQRFKDSLLRHIYQYLMGDTDEDHLAAVLFNAHGCAMIDDKLELDKYNNID